MIRINLLAEGRRPAVARRPKAVAAAEQLGQWLLLATIGLAVIVILAWGFLLRRDIAQKDQEIAVAQREVEELAPIIREVEEYKAKKSELERKIRVISDLKANQSGPVQIMDYVSRALPELLWLDRMEVNAGTMTLTGRAFNTNAVANLIDNLDKVPEFQEPILRDTTQQGRVYSYVITLGYSFTSPEPTAEEAGAPVEAPPPTGG
jgi:Tfp pilus assembly protein PilN